MTQVATAPSDGAQQEPGLRERKKRATHRSLRRAALALVAERGLDEVTVDQIAAAADVSPRTFFNYFATKEDALSGIDPDAIEDTCRAIVARPRAESPTTAVRTVFVERAAVAAQDTEFWRLRSQVARDYPELLARIMGASAAADRLIGLAVAERMGVAVDDPRPHLIAGVCTTTRRVAMQTWLAGGQRRELTEVLTECFEQVARELCAS